MKGPPPSLSPPGLHRCPPTRSWAHLAGAGPGEEWHSLLKVAFVPPPKGRGGYSAASSPPPASGHTEPLFYLRTPGQASLHAPSLRGALQAHRHLTSLNCALGTRQRREAGTPRAEEGVTRTFQKYPRPAGRPAGAGRLALLPTQSAQR